LTLLREARDSIVPFTVVWEQGDKISLTWIALQFAHVLNRITQRDQIDYDAREIPSGQTPRPCPRHDVL
jgi:hypothetical protein